MQMHTNTYSHVHKHAHTHPHVYTGTHIHYNTKSKIINKSDARLNSCLVGLILLLIYEFML